MSQEQEETEDENNPPESGEPELEPESEPGTESEQNENPGPGSGGGNNEFEFYFQFTKPLVLYLPSPDERAIAAAWVQKLESQPVNAEEKQLRLNYLKLLLFVLQRGHLTGIFRKQPPSGALQPFPQGFTMMDMGNLMIDQGEAPGAGGGDTRAVPYTIELSNDLREFVAAQEIPNFGVQMYYAWSADEPVYKWSLFNENNFPKYIIEKIKLLKEAKSEEKGGILDKICKKKPCEIPLLERIPKSKVKSPEEIEQTQARSYQTYVGLVGRMGNPYKGVCDDDQDKYNKQEQRKCRGQRTKKGSGSMPMPMVEAMSRAEDLGAYYRPHGQPQGHVVCRCPPTFHLPNCEVRRAPVERWQGPNVPPNAPGMAPNTFMRGERAEQGEEYGMPPPEGQTTVQESPYIPRMRPTSRESERITYRGPLTKKPASSTLPRKGKSQSAKGEEGSKRNEGVVSKRSAGAPSKPGAGKCFCTTQQCSCPCPRAPPAKGKRSGQPAGQPSSQPVSQPISQAVSQPISQPTSAGQGWPPQQPQQPQQPPQPPPQQQQIPLYAQINPSAPLPEWARRGLIQQGLLNPNTGEFICPPNQEQRSSRKRWNIVPPEQRPPPCIPKDSSPTNVPAVPSQQMNRREDKLPATPGPSTAPTQREEVYPTVTKPTQKPLQGQNGSQRPGPFAVGTGGRLADMAGILAEIKQKTEAHKIKCKPVNAKTPDPVANPSTPVQTPQSQPTPPTVVQCEPILQISTQTTTKPTVPVHQPVPTGTKYGGATYSRQPRRPDYWDVMERRRRGQRVAKDLFGGKEAYNKGLEGIEPLAASVTGDEGEYCTDSDDDFIDSSSSLEGNDDQDRTLVPQCVPETPDQDTTFSQTLTQDNVMQNQQQQQQRPKFFASTPKDNFPADMSSILHCGPPPGTLSAIQTTRREPVSPDYDQPDLPYYQSPESRRANADAAFIQDSRNQRTPRIYASTPKDTVFPADISPIVNCTPIAYDTTSTLQAGSPTLIGGSPTIQAGSPTIMGASPTIQAGSPTIIDASPTIQAGTPTILPNYPNRKLQQGPDYFEPLPPAPGGTYFGTPDPRQPQAFYTMDSYQAGSSGQYSSRTPNDCIPNNEPIFSPVCTPEADNSFPSGAFSSTLTPGTPSAQVTPSEVRSRRSPERRNRSASRTPRRENMAPTGGTPTQTDECVNEPPREPTWATWHGVTMTESERAALRSNNTTWATLHGEWEGERSRRDNNNNNNNNNTWATLHGEWEGDRSRRDNNNNNTWATLHGEWEGERPRRDGTWGTMNGEFCDDEW